MLAQQNTLGATDVTQGGAAAVAVSTMNQSKNLLQKRQKKPAYMQSLNEHEKAENFKIIDNMNKKINYLKNPRFQVSKGPILFTQVSTTITVIRCEIKVHAM